MKAEDIKTKSEDELKKLLLDLRKEQFNFRFQRKNGTLENTAQMRGVRRNIARIKTFLKLKTNEETKAAPKTSKSKAA